MSEREHGRLATSQSLERGLAILSSFSAERRSIGVSEMAEELGLTRSTAHRYIATLAGLGYLNQDPATRKYLLGPRVLELGFTAINSMELRDVAAPHLRRLCDETGHTVNMAILDDVDIVYVERFRASRRHQNEIDLDLHVGSRLPAYCTSMGKVLLAFLPDAERDELLSRITFSRRGPNTLTTRTALLAELGHVRATGIAVNNEELAYGLRSVAVPVLAANGRAVAAVNLAAHRTMASLDDLVARIGPVMQQTASAISAQLGYRSTPA
jgi:IclR family transcriptional regulator, pca regulon regulatory protein